MRADALATPVTQFDSDKNSVSDAIRRSRPSTSALNLEQAFEFAQQAQRLQSQKAGEIVFVGAGPDGRDLAGALSALTGRGILANAVGAAYLWQMHDDAARAGLDDDPHAIVVHYEALLADPHPLVHSGAAAWHRPKVRTDALVAWLRSPPVVIATSSISRSRSG